MLVVSRKKGERILVSPDIEIVVVEVRGDRVRIGVSAPQGTQIVRNELVERSVKK